MLGQGTGQASGQNRAYINTQRGHCVRARAAIFVLFSNHASSCALHYSGLEQIFPMFSLQIVQRQQADCWRANGGLLGAARLMKINLCNSLN